MLVRPMIRKHLDGLRGRCNFDAARAFLRAMPKLFTRMHMHDITVQGKVASGEVVAEYKSDGLTKAGRAYPNVYVGFLEVRDGNPAVRLYKRTGFSEVGRRRDYYSGCDGQLFDALTLAKSFHD